MLGLFNWNNPQLFTWSDMDSLRLSILVQDYLSVFSVVDLVVDSSISCLLISEILQFSTKSVLSVISHASQRQLLELTDSLVTEHEQLDGFIQKRCNWVYPPGDHFSENYPVALFFEVKSLQLIWADLQMRCRFDSVIGYQESSPSNCCQCPLLLTWFNFNPSMDK